MKSEAFIAPVFIVTTLLAVHATASNLLANWKGSQGKVLSQNSTVEFPDHTNGALTTNSVENPFVAFKGTYRGLFLDTNDGVMPTNSGYALFTVNANGFYSGKLSLGDRTHSVSGRFLIAPDYDEGDNSASIEFHLKDAPGEVLDVTLQLSLDTNSSDVGTGLLTGNVNAFADASEDNLLWSASLSAEPFTHTSNSPPSGVFIFGLAPIGYLDPSLGPGGYSYGTLRLSKTGEVALACNLADGSPMIMCSSALARDNSFPFFASLYGGREIMLGSLEFTNDTLLFNDTEVGVESEFMAWAKLPTPGRFYTNGFSSSSGGLQSFGNRYVPPKTGTNIWGETNLDFLPDFRSTGALNPTFLTFDPQKNRFVIQEPNTRKLELSFNPLTGTYAGSFLSASEGRRYFRGSLMPGFRAGWGFYLETNQETSSVYLGTPGP